MQGYQLLHTSGWFMPLLLGNLLVESCGFQQVSQQGQSQVTVVDGVDFHLVIQAVRLL